MSLVQTASAHILAQFHAYRQDTPSTVGPLFVAIQGPQGCGKTYLASQLRQVLESPLHALSVAILSIDDLLLPYDQLLSLSESHPQNLLLKGRGLPGTHDIELGRKLLNDLSHINEPAASGDSREVEIPSFDKSLHGGAGDRIEVRAVKRAPVDIVIVEGWCMGFCPITTEDIDKRWSEPVQGFEDVFSPSKYRKDDIVEVNEMLKDYQDFWPYFRVCIQVQLASFTWIYKWRLQQEHEMKARNGGIGMDDDIVHSFVDRFIPGYVFFGDGVRQGMKNADGTCRLPSWIGNGLAITVGEERDVVDVTNF